VKGVVEREEGDVLSDAINIIFIDLTKLEDVLKVPVEDMDLVTKWALFFKYADNAEHKFLIDKIVQTRREIKMANNILTNISQDEAERARAISRQKFLWDLEHNMNAAREEGLEEGIIKGLELGKAEGLEEGISKGMELAALRLFELGLPLDIISKSTGLSAEELETL
jgi:predicted transposase/invertase (TIGR01784 family)